MGLKITRTVLMIVLILGVPMAFVWADSPCSPCSCSGNADCKGCRQCSSGGDIPLVGNVMVPPATYYNYCEPQMFGSSSCATGTVTCWTSPPNTQTPIYGLNDTACMGSTSKTNLTMYAFVGGACEPGQDGGP